jgi:Protein of unknown function (DUF3054)
MQDAPPPPWRRIAAAPLIDVACLCLFVLLGRQSHDITGGGGWFFVVVWPFLAGWFAVAIGIGLYAARRRLAVRLVATEIVGVAIALTLRDAVTHRATPLAFIAVAFGFIAVTTLGWRVIVAVLTHQARRRHTRRDALTTPPSRR